MIMVAAQRQQNHTWAALVSKLRIASSSLFPFLDYYQSEKIWSLPLHKTRSILSAWTTKKSQLTQISERKVLHFFLCSHGILTFEFDICEGRERCTTMRQHCQSLVVVLGEMLALLAGSIRRTSMLFQVRLHQHWGSWAPRFGWWWQ